MDAATKTAFLEIIKALEEMAKSAMGASQRAAIDQALEKAKQAIQDSPDTEARGH